MRTVFFIARRAIVAFLLIAAFLLLTGRDSILRTDRPVVHPSRQNA